MNSKQEFLQGFVDDLDKTEKTYMAITTKSDKV